MKTPICITGWVSVDPVGVRTPAPMTNKTAKAFWVDISDISCIEESAAGGCFVTCNPLQITLYTETSHQSLAADIEALGRISHGR